MVIQFMTFSLKQKLKRNIIKEYFWYKILLTDEKFGSKKSGKKMT